MSYHKRPDKCTTKFCRGQKQIIKVYRLMIPETVDDAVAEALTTKAENESRLITALQMIESYRNK